LKKELSHRSHELKALGWNQEDLTRYEDLWDYSQRWGLINLEREDRQFLKKAEKLLPKIQNKKISVKKTIEEKSYYLWLKFYLDEINIFSNFNLPKNKYFITLNQWFDESLLNETDIQPLYYPSINKENFDNYKIKYFNAFNEDPTHLSLLSYDLVGLVYYLSMNSKIEHLNKIFKKKNSFKGKIGIFDIKNNKINHRLNFYKIEDQKLIEIF